MVCSKTTCYTPQPSLILDMSSAVLSMALWKMLAFNCFFSSSLLGNRKTLQGKRCGECGNSCTLLLLRTVDYCCCCLHTGIVMEATEFCLGGAGIVLQRPLGDSNYACTSPQWLWLSPRGMLVTWPDCPNKQATILSCVLHDLLRFGGLRLVQKQPDQTASWFVCCLRSTCLQMRFDHDSIHGCAHCHFLDFEGGRIFSVCPVIRVSARTDHHPLSQSRNATLCGS